MELLILLYQLLHNPHIEYHYSTIFATPGDKWLGGPSPCLRDENGKLRKVRPDDNIIAHRTLPCGTVVRIFNPLNGKTTVARVGERGPYGACIKPGWKVGDKCPGRYWRLKRKPWEPGIWRGAFDLTPRVARRIGHNGFQPIVVQVLKYPTKKTRKHRKRHRRSRGGLAALSR